jgi:hypothetical protein
LRWIFIYLIPSLCVIIKFFLPTGKFITQTFGGNIKLVRPFLFYVLLYAAYASAMTYIVVYYQGLGFSGSPIGILTGPSPLITFFGAPSWTRRADSPRRFSGSAARRAAFSAARSWKSSGPRIIPGA